MMVQQSRPEPMLSDDERALLAALPIADPNTAPIDLAPGADGYTWSFKSLRAGRSFSSHQEAFDHFLRYHAMLLEGARVERERTYTVEPGHG